MTIRPLTIMAALPTPDPLDVDDVLRRIDEAHAVHAFLDRHGAPRHDEAGTPLSPDARAREIGRRLSRHGK